MHPGGGGDKGEWWRGLIHIYVRTFVNAQMYPPPSTTFFKKC
jgi:hypothetical protein